MIPARLPNGFRANGCCSNLLYLPPLQFYQESSLRMTSTMTSVVKLRMEGVVMELVQLNVNCYGLHLKILYGLPCQYVLKLNQKYFLMLRYHVCVHSIYTGLVIKMIAMVKA